MGQHGRPQDSADEHWFLAEEALRNEHREASKIVANLVLRQQTTPPSDEAAPAVNALREAVGKPTPGKHARKRRAS